MNDQTLTATPIAPAPGPAAIAAPGPARSWALLVQERLSSLGEPVAPVPAEAASAAPARPRKPRPEAADGASASPRARPARTPAAAPEGDPAAASGAPAATTGPEAPDTADGPQRARRTTGGRPRGRGPAAVGGATAVLRRVLATGRGRAGAGVAAVVLLLVVLLVAGVFGGGDESSDRAALPEATENQALAVQFAAAMPQTIPFRPPSGVPAEFASATGVARPTVSSDDPSVPVLALEIEGLPAPAENRRYFVWADRNGANPVFLGELPAVSGAQLPFQGVDVASGQTVIVDPTVYSRVRVTRETSESPSGPGQTVLVGTITPPQAD